MKFKIFSARTFALLCIAMGIVGYRTQGSMISLIAGVGSGCIILILSFMLSMARIWTLYSMIAVITVLVIVFGKRFLASGNFYPSGMMMLFSIATLITLLPFKKGPSS